MTSNEFNTRVNEIYKGLEETQEFITSSHKRLDAINKKIELYESAKNKGTIIWFATVAVFVAAAVAYRVINISKYFK